jgi:uncharacterized repeat protein (TIGR03803 family)
MICLALLFCATARIPLPAQDIFFTSLVSFDWTNGAWPYGRLVQGTDGNFYGITYYGGVFCPPNGCGTVFKMTPARMLTTLHSFDGTDGKGPAAGLIQATDGNFYGTTGTGGAVGYGTVFRITAAGALTTLYSFCSQPNCIDGVGPSGELVQGTDGNLYGTTLDGGAHGYGTVFKITAAGRLTTLYSFCTQAGCIDGENPSSALAEGTDGNFYGTTFYGGAPVCFGGTQSCGTVFRISPAGTLSTLHSFNFNEGAYPDAGLVQATDGNFYGTTFGGGTYFEGAAFKITPGGALTTLHSFDGTDGANPIGGLVQATDGNFYATTYAGGAYSDGTVFKITPTGTLTTLHSFDYSDGTQPFGGLVQATDGNFYGMTRSGGAYDEGTAFRLGVVRTCATCRP